MYILYVYIYINICTFLLKLLYVRIYTIMYSCIYIHALHTLYVQVGARCNGATGLDHHGPSLLATLLSTTYSVSSFNS